MQRVGFGYDIHRLVGGRPLILGGVSVASALGEDGHSDGDVLAHAIIVALFGAVCDGDIGTHFPPEDPTYRDISSRVLLARSLEIIVQAGWQVSNVDCTVVLERPRLAPVIGEIRALLAGDLGVAPGHISVKAKTGEGLGPVGAGLAIEAYATVLVASQLSMTDAVSH